jgi:hypothetical protein
LIPSFPEVEVLVIEGGSTDQSLAGAMAIDDPGVCVVQLHDPPQLIAAALFAREDEGQTRVG